jgi:hypothetical protein
MLKWSVHQLEQRRPGEERELLRLRRRETAIVLVATAIPYATAIVVLVVLASIFVSRNAAALGGTAFVGVLVGFAAQRFLMDIVAGVLIVFERWYGVGDFVMIDDRGWQVSRGARYKVKPDAVAVSSGSGGHGRESALRCHSGARLVFGRRLAERDEEVGEVVAEVAGVAAAEHRVDVDADLQTVECANSVARRIRRICRKIE